MSSLEIAEVTGKEHRNVMRDIKTTLEQAGIGLLKFEQSYLNAQNKPQPCYHLPRLECDLVMSGYSVPYRLAILKRWHELEAKAAAPAVKEITIRESLVLNLELLDKNEAQAQQLQIKTRELAAKDEQLEEQRPKVRAFDKLMDSDGLYGVRDTAKAPGRTLTSLPPSRGRTSRIVFSGCLPRFLLIATSRRSL